MSKEIVMIGTAPEARSGIAAVVNVYLAQGLFRRWRVRFIATHGDGGKLRKALIAARGWLGFMALLLTGRVALLHVLAASNASFWRKALFVLPAHALGAPYLMHMHCGRFVDFYSRECPSWAQRLVRHMFRHARAVVALSEQWREALSAISPDSRVVTIPNPIDIPAWQARLEGPIPTVLFLGVLKEAKGVNDLLNAWAKVLQSIPHARLLLGGTGDLDAANELARRLGIESSVEMPGWVVGKDKEALLRQAWVFTLPSHAEALPMSVLECMAAGIPVVASRVGGIPLAVEDGRTGHLVEPRDPRGLAKALIGLLTDAGNRRAMGNAARRRAEEAFSAEVLVPQIEALWRSIAPQQEASAAPLVAARAATLKMQ
jgi:glycosyltransferase involved in cell wall biosynthesis